ncbi:hypothetical protein, partial [Collinsella stercoris]|uniref:hypothetical protein n=1 Tax=Collinsella stercoris TaxID=147206 RepID=UPI00248E45F7
CYTHAFIGRSTHTNPRRAFFCPDFADFAGGLTAENQQICTAVAGILLQGIFQHVVANWLL